MRYTLIEDDDGHWYLCPAEKQQEARNFLDDTAIFWAKGEMGEPPQFPSFLKEIDGPHRLTFENPKE